MSDQSKGCLIFAFNSGDINYVEIAEVNARLIKKHLNLPTTLVTDTKCPSDAFDNVIVVSYTETNRRNIRDASGELKSVNWKNIGRDSAYALTPYDRTVLLDADYIVNSDALVSVINSSAELACFRYAFDVTNKAETSIDPFISFNSIDMYWATVVIFNKTEFTQCVFNLMQDVKDQWDHYKALYNFPAGPYRNDFSFSVALHTASGLNNNTVPNTIPWMLPTATSDTELVKISDRRIVVKKGSTTVPVQGDLHLMNKWFDVNVLKGLL